LYIKKLSHQIFKILFYVTFIFFFLVTIGASFYKYSLLKNQYILSMKGQVNIAKSLIASQLLKDDKRFSKIVALAHNKKNHAEMLEDLSRSLQSFDPFDMFYVLDSSKKIICISKSHEKSYLNLNIGHMNHVVNKKKISRVFQSIFSKQSVVALTYPVGSEYCLVIERDLQNIIPSLTIIEKGLLLPGQIIFIVDDQGKTIYHPDQDLVRTRHNLLFDFKDYTERSDRKLSSYDYNGKSFLAYSERLDIPKQWQLFIQVPSAGIRNNILSSMAWLFLLLLTLFSVVIVTLQFVLNHFFSRPVHNIARELASYKSDNRKGAVITDDRAGKIQEFNLIIEAVNSMADDLIQSNVLIRQREKHIRVLLDSTAEAIYGMDTRGRCTFCNNSFLKMLGYNKEKELLNNNIHSMIHHTYPDGSSYPNGDCTIHHAFINGKPCHSEMELFQRKDGSCFFVECWSHPIFVDKKVSGAVATFIDISERLVAQKKLQESEEKYRGLVESTSDWIWEINAKCVYTYTSPQIEAILGYRPEEILGKTPFDLMPPEEAMRVAGKFKKLIEAGKPVSALENINLHKNGRHIVLETSGIPILDTEGRIVAYRGVDRDVTERKKMEEMMIQTEKMLTVGGLAAGMAHEINNPLAGMIQTNNVMNDRLTHSEMEANLCAAKEAGITMEGIKAFMEKRGILRMIKTINESGHRVSEIVDNMLSFTRKSDDLLSTHNPVELMDNILKLAATDYDLKKNYDFKTIEIIKEYEENLPLVPCEGSKIQQVLLNILTNGAQAMQEIKEKNSNHRPRFILRLFRETGTDMLRIEIEDNGPGMDEEIRKRIFEPFYTTKPTGMGTGLGLSVSYFIIVENHGGTMDVSSEPGKGANFIVRLPLKRITAK
jgi:PAS domain S-box-containing protein